MSKILVLGGGIVGLSTAMMLARRGHDVTVFERDSKPLPASPEDAWQGWERRGVAQFRQPHYLQLPKGISGKIQRTALKEFEIVAA
jgi:glycine/D-amino acid oxidase-like deaminating enzyme